MAEREGFEPSIRLLTRYSLSRGAPSASRASLRIQILSNQPSVVCSQSASMPPPHRSHAMPPASCKRSRLDLSGISPNPNSFKSTIIGAPSRHLMTVPLARTTNDRQNRSIRIKASPLVVKPCDVPASAVGRFVPGRLVGLDRRTSTRLVFLLDALVYLFAMYRDILRRRDTDAYLVALHAQHRNGYMIADHQGFPNPAGQNQHDRTPFTRIHWTRKPRRAFPSGSRIAAKTGRSRTDANASRCSGSSITRNRPLRGRSNAPRLYMNGPSPAMKPA